MRERAKLQDWTLSLKTLRRPAALWWLQNSRVSGSRRKASGNRGVIIFRMCGAVWNGNVILGFRRILKSCWRFEAHQTDLGSMSRCLSHSWHSWPVEGTCGALVWVLLDQCAWWSMWRPVQAAWMVWRELRDLNSSVFSDFVLSMILLETLNHGLLEVSSVDGQHLMYKVFCGDDQSIQDSWVMGVLMPFSKDMPSSASRKRMGRCAGQRDLVSLGWSQVGPPTSSVLNKLISSVKCGKKNPFN